MIAVKCDAISSRFHKAGPQQLCVRETLRSETVGYTSVRRASRVHNAGRSKWAHNTCAVQYAAPRLARERQGRTDLMSLPSQQ
ncbi:unnamed protein product, partial [Iphiclides podalirius]